MKENVMIDDDDQIRYLRVKFLETDDDNEKEFIIQQLKLLESEDTVVNQKLLVE